MKFHLFLTHVTGIATVTRKVLSTHLKRHERRERLEKSQSSFRDRGG